MFFTCLGNFLPKAPIYPGGLLGIPRPFPFRIREKSFPDCPNPSEAPIINRLIISGGRARDCQSKTGRTELLSDYRGLAPPTASRLPALKRPLLEIQISSIANPHPQRF